MLHNQFKFNSKNITRKRASQKGKKRNRECRASKSQEKRVFQEHQMEVKGKKSAEKSQGSSWSMVFM
jgi:hypothetical protein